MCYRNHEHLPTITPKVKIMDAPFSFNRSIRIRSRRDRITGDSGALTGRELLGRSRVVRFLAKRLPDKRDGRRIRHSQKRLARTLLLLVGQGRREHSDATELRDDPALRLATSDRAGTAPMGKAGRLPSQPTLSRRVAAWSAKEGVEVLREGLQRLAGWRLKAMGGWRRPKTLVIDIDSLPVEVHGEQPGSAWNGYYHRRVYHPIVAAVGETGDILDLRLREGAGAYGGRRAGVRPRGAGAGRSGICAGRPPCASTRDIPASRLMAALEERGTHYVARVRNNAVLKRLALPAMDAAVWDALSNGVPAGEPRTWVCESSYRAGSWSRSRRVVQVVVERPGELIPRSFWLLTSIPSGEMSGEDLLALYRKRGKAEGHLGELMSVRRPGPVVHVAPQEPLPGQGDQEAREGGRRLRLQPGAPAARRLRLPDHARPARRAGARDRHRLEPAAPCRTRASHPGALHRLGPPDHDDHRRRVGALAHARPRTRDPARALWIAGPPPRRQTLPRPRRPQGRRGVSKRRRKARPSLTTTPFGPETPVLGLRNRPDMPSGLPSRVARGPSAPHLTLDPEVHE